MLPKSCTGMPHTGEVSSSPSTETLVLSSCFWKAEVFFCLTEVRGAFNTTSKPRPLSQQPQLFESLNLDHKLALVLKMGIATKRKKYKPEVHRYQFLKQTKQWFCVLFILTKAYKIYNEEIYALKFCIFLKEKHIWKHSQSYLKKRSCRMTSGEELSCNLHYLAENLTLGFACWKSVPWDAFQGRRQYPTQSKWTCVIWQPDKKKLTVILRKKTHKTQRN